MRGVEIHGQQRIGAARILGIDDGAVRLKKHEGELVRRASPVHVRRQTEIEGKETARRERRSKYVQKGAVDERHAGGQVAAFTAEGQRGVDGTRASSGTKQEIAERDRVVGIAGAAAVGKNEGELECSEKSRSVEADRTGDDVRVRRARVGC